MRDAIYQAIQLLLESDATVSDDNRQRILETCRAPVKAKRRRLGTVRQAAEILGCHTRTVQRYVAQGNLTVIRHSARKIRYDLDEVESFSGQGIH